MSKSYYCIKHDNKELKTLEDLQGWYMNKIRELQKEDKDFDELPFVEDERKIVIDTLSEFVPDDNDSALFKNALWRYLSTFLNARLWVAKDKHDTESDHYPRIIKWYNESIEMLKDKNLRIKFVKEEIVRAEENSLDWIKKGADFNDKRLKAEFEAGQKYLEFLKSTEQGFHLEAQEGGIVEDQKVFKLNPTHNFELLKEHRKKYFEERKSRFISDRKLKSLETKDGDVNQCYVFWLQDELKVIDLWLSDKYPNGKPKGIRQRDSERVELLKYQSFVQEEIRKLNQKPPTDELLKSSINEFEYLENIISNHKTQGEIFKLFVIEKGIKDIHEERQKHQGGKIPGEREFFEITFARESKRVINAIHDHVFNLDTDNSKSAYLNQAYRKIAGLLEKNEEQRELFRNIGDSFSEDLLHYSFYLMELSNLKKVIVRDYKNYLDLDLLFNTDDRKFENRILCSYHQQLEIINKHSKHDCHTRIRAEETSKNLFEDLSQEYFEQYDYIVQKWVKTKRANGHEVNETHFINSQLNRMNTIFKYDKIKETYSATNFEQKIFVFSREYYEKYMTNIFPSIINHLKSKLEEIESLQLSIPEKKEGLPMKSKPSKISDKSFIYNCGDDTEVNLDQLHDKLVENSLIDKPKDIRTFRKTFSGNQIKTPIVWRGSLYELHFFIQLLIDGKKIEKCNQFVIASKCFRNSENEPINYKSLRTATNEPATASLLKSIVGSL